MFREGTGWSFEPFLRLLGGPKRLLRDQKTPGFCRPVAILGTPDNQILDKDASNVGIGVVPRVGVMCSPNPLDCWSRTGFRSGDDTPWRGSSTSTQQALMALGVSLLAKEVITPRYCLAVSHVILCDYDSRPQINFPSSTPFTTGAWQDDSTSQAREEKSIMRSAVQMQCKKTCSLTVFG